MTNLEIYNLLKVKLNTADLILTNMERMLDTQKELVDNLDYDVSEMWSKLTDDELLSLEGF
jgi:trans-2-enoyl-CoA reductase